MLHTETAAVETETQDGDKSVTVSLRFSDGNYSSGSRAHLTWAAGRALLRRLSEIYGEAK
ncbi:hypothetical protein ACFORO_42650 [Amycolatopsis halotolerans]|uniref:Uncharacterized protein n=1 Tax=Amycolatopsis halotolerans TaxID=330083 RepID=A0ABV7R0J9_9PSEU